LWNRGTGGAIVGGISGAVAGGILGAVIGAIVGTRTLPQEGQASLTLSLERGEARYMPGECLSGTVEVRAENTLRIAGARVYLVCRGFYTHDRVDGQQAEPEFVRDERQYYLQEQQLLPSMLLRKGTIHRQAFRFTLPKEALPTHHGYICALRWTLHALVEIPDLPELKANREIYVEALPATFPSVNEGYQSITNAAPCQLILTLPQVVYAEGEVVRGRAYLTPSEVLAVDEVRAVLLRVENTPAGDDHIVYVNPLDPLADQWQGERRPGGQGTTYVWLEDETTLSGPLRLNPAESAAFPFALTIPAQWRPTLVSPDGKVIWKVGILVSPVGRSTVRVFHEVLVHTGAREVTEMIKDEG